MCIRDRDITAFESVPAQFDYIAADITAAYNSTRWAEPGNTAKVSLVTRQFLYLRSEEAFVVSDRVETTRPEYLPKFLLHHLSKPRTQSERLLSGNSVEDGILETADRELLSSHLRGILSHHVLLPAQARTLKVGGPNYNCYVEEDGDPSDGFDGVNLEGGDPLQPRPTAQLGLWRTEVEPSTPGTSHRFLNVLLPRLESSGGALPEVEVVDAGAGAYAARVGSAVVVFAGEAKPLDEINLKVKTPGRLILVDAAPDRQYMVRNRRVRASREGVLSTGLPSGAIRIVQVR